MDTSPCKLQIKLGEAEFNAEGPQDVIQSAFEKFLAAIEKTPRAQTKAPLADLGLKNGESTKGQEDSEIDSTILERMYDMDSKKGIVSLRVLPQDSSNRPADAAILTLYGAKAVLHTPELPVTRLKAGLKKSGIQVDRVDRLMVPCAPYIIKGGVGVAGKYSLNNQGVIQAETLIRKIFS